MRASTDSGLAVFGSIETAVYSDSASAAGLPPARVSEVIAGFRAAVGPPWAQDQKLATAAAWLALARAGRGETFNQPSAAGR
jgi:hypothetical protein